MTHPAAALLPIIALFACAKGAEPLDIGEDSQEWWLCDHVESQYSALVIAKNIITLQ